MIYICFCWRHSGPRASGHSCSLSVSLPNRSYVHFLGKLHMGPEQDYTGCHQSVTELGETYLSPQRWNDLVFSLFSLNSTLVCCIMLFIYSIINCRRVLQVTNCLYLTYHMNCICVSQIICLLIMYIQPMSFAYFL